MKIFLCALLINGVSLADEGVPKQVRLSIQFIEVSHPALTEWLGQGESGVVIHEKAMAQAKSGEAKILETCVVICRSGQKATVESVLEEIFPFDNSPPELPASTGSYAIVSGATNPILRPITDWETRNLGLSLKVEPLIGESGQIVDLRFLTEFLQRLKLETMMEHKDQWGDATLRMPIYEKWATNTALTLQSGKSELASVITPEKQPPVPAVSRRVLIFVRADVIESR